MSQNVHVSQNGKCPRMASVSNGICLNGKCLHMATVPTGKCPKWQVSTGQVSPTGKCPQGNCLRMATVAWQVSDWQVSEGQVSASPFANAQLDLKGSSKWCKLLPQIISRASRLQFFGSSAYKNESRYHHHHIHTNQAH